VNVLRRSGRSDARHHRRWDHSGKKGPCHVTSND
jgi:hypothetical protein